MDKVLKKIAIITGIISFLATLVLCCMYAKRMNEYLSVVKSKAIALTKKYINRYKGITDEQY